MTTFIPRTSNCFKFLLLFLKKIPGLKKLQNLFGICDFFLQLLSTWFCQIHEIIWGFRQPKMALKIKYFCIATYYTCTVRTHTVNYSDSKQLRTVLHVYSTLNLISLTYHNSNTGISIKNHLYGKIQLNKKNLTIPYTESKFSKIITFLYYSCLTKKFSLPSFHFN